ncbi:MAG: zinc ribbon domain-containing protein [Azoarcus sp.]|jgi:hypothetical protein|nr:zinc ribbon domain-containing protein [Azoarcus sp.]
MSPNQPVPGASYVGLLRAVEALRNEKALFVLLATGLLPGASIFLLSSPRDSGVPALAVLFVVASLLLLPVGISAAGLLLMDQARGQTPRPLGRAVAGGLFAALRLIVISLAGVAAMAVFFLFLGILLFACKIPFLGPVFYAVFFPILTVAAGLLFLGLFAVQSMAGPAIWNGATVSETLSMLARIAARRGGELLTSLFLLGMLVVLAEFVIFSIVATGCQIVLGMSVSILGSGSGATDFFGHFLGFTRAIAASEYMYATAFGFILVMMLAMTAIMALVLMGLNLIYLRITGDPPPAGTDSPSMPPPIPGKAQKAPPPPEARAAMSAAVAPADTSIANDVPDILAGLFTETPPVPPVSTCPHCQAAIQPGDRFCGECGRKIQG